MCSQPYKKLKATQCCTTNSAVAPNQQVPDAVDGGDFKPSTSKDSTPQPGDSLSHPITEHIAHDALPASFTYQGFPKQDSLLLQPLSDHIIARISPLLPANGLRVFACDVLGLTHNQYDACCFVSTTLSDAIYQCLIAGVKRLGISHISGVLATIENASKDDVLSVTFLRENQHLVGKDAVSSAALRTLAEVLAKHVDKRHVETLFCGYFCLSQEEVRNALPEPPNHVTVSRNILMNWRTNNQQTHCNSVQHLTNTMVASGMVDDDVFDAILVALGRASSLEKSNICSTLKRLYSEELHTLNPLPWMPEVRKCALNDIFLTLYVSRAHSNENNTISMNDLFIQKRLNSSECAKRMLIHGEAGSGKTTLTAKIVLDWATGQTHIKGVLKFTAVFLIKACLVHKDDSFESYARRECLPVDVDWTNQLHELSEQDVLIVIDGYDENPEAHCLVKSLLERKQFNRSTILITSRFGATHNILDLVDCDVTLKGLTRTDVKDFINRYANEKTQENFMKLYAANHPFIQILCNPLYLWFFAILGDDYYKDIQSFTRTDFYSHTFDGILEKARHKLISNSYEINELDNSVSQLCVLAYDCIKNDKLEITGHIEENDLMLILGIINTTISRCGLKRKTVYMFAHKTILEFLAARYIYDISRKDASLCVPAIQAMKNQNGTSMFLVFLFGLFKDNLLLYKDLMQCCLPVLSAESGVVSSQHHRHIVLSCLAELDHMEGFPTELLVGRSDDDILVDQKCAPFCVRGVQKLNEIKTLKSVSFTACHTQPVKSINAASCSFRDCGLSFTLLTVATLNQVSLQELDVGGFSLSFTEFKELMSHIHCLQNLRKLELFKLNMSSKDCRFLANKPQHLQILELLRAWELSAEVCCYILENWWATSEKVELYRVDLATPQIMEAISGCSDDKKLPTCVKLKRLHNDTISRVVAALGDSVYVNTLSELEVWCGSDEDCCAVARFVSRCRSLQTFRWRCRRVTADRSFPGYFWVTRQAIINMWYQILTHATWLQKVVVQEFSNIGDFDISSCAPVRNDDIFISVIQDKLSLQQRNAVQWIEVHMIDKCDSARVSEEECSKVYTLLSEVTAVYKGCDKEMHTGRGEMEMLLVKKR